MLKYFIFAGASLLCMTNASSAADYWLCAMGGNRPELVKIVLDEKGMTRFNSAEDRRQHMAKFGSELSPDSATPYSYNSEKLAVSMTVLEFDTSPSAVWVTIVDKSNGDIKRMSTGGGDMDEARANIGKCQKSGPFEP